MDKSDLAKISEWMHSRDGADLYGDFKSWHIWRRSAYNGMDELSVLQQLIKYPEFNSLLRYRIRKSATGQELTKIIKGPFQNNLSISTASIGPGLRIQHGYSTFILAQSIGSNFWINQNVTIGNARGGKPVIGDNVTIRTGAVVVGPINIGNNVTIFANCVVSQDLPDNCTVYPARSHIQVEEPSSALKINDY